MTNPQNRFKEAKTRHTLLIVAIVLLSIGIALIGIGAAMFVAIHKITNKSAKGQQTDVV